MHSDFGNIQELYKELESNRDRSKPLWDDISKFVAIQTDPQYAYEGGHGNKSDQLDQYVDDPTAAISVNQAGDYLAGIMWGNGNDVVRLKPSRYVTELEDPAVVGDWFAFATNQLLYHMNHPQSGYQTALRPYMYDQVGYGTSGIGIFKNPAFEKGVEDNALLCRNYGVDNIVIDEGKNGMIDYVFVTYNWRTNRVVQELAMKDGVMDKDVYNKLPRDIKQAWERKDFNRRFDVVFGMLPRDDFDPSLKGKRGKRYRGVWFMGDRNLEGNDQILMEESFDEKPINIARMIVIRGDVWGRSSGTMLISTIRSVNYMIGSAIEVIEKMNDPALGIMNNAVFGDSVLDTSPTGLTVFNSSLAGGNQSPIFPLFDVGDPSALINFLVPYLNEKIATAFKIDTLLDFASNREMTATESMHRFVIRGQSLSGILSQQKNERLVPDVKRAVSILMEMRQLGVDPTVQEDRAARLREINKTERIIPEAVRTVIASGRPWFELEFNNELEKLSRTQAIQDLLQLLNTVGSAAQMDPNIVQAVDWYNFVAEANNNLSVDNKILLSRRDFDASLQAQAQQQQAAQALAAGGQAAAAQKDLASAEKLDREAQNA